MSWDDATSSIVLGYMQFGFAVCSILGSLFIAISIVLLERTNKAHGRFLLYLACCQLILSAAYLMSSDPVGIIVIGDNAKCLAQGVIIQFFNTASWIWTSCIAWNMWTHIVHGATNESVIQKEKYLHLIAWGIPALCCSNTFYGHPPDSSEQIPWCWTMSAEEVVFDMIFYFPLIFVIVLNFSFIAHVIYKVKHDFSENEEVLNGMISTRSESKIKEFTVRIILYPMVLVLCYSGALADRMVMYFSNEQIFVLGALHLLMAWDGFLTAIVYGISSSLPGTYKKRWKQWRRRTDGLESFEEGYEKVDLKKSLLCN